MLDWILVYVVVFFFVFLFQYMVNFFDVSDPEKATKTRNSRKKSGKSL